MITEKLNYKWAGRIVIPVIALVICLTDKNFHLTAIKSSLNFLSSLIYVTCYWQLNLLFVVYIAKKIRHTQNSKRRIGLQLSFVIGFVLFAGIVLDIVNYTLPGLAGPNSLLKDYVHIVEKSLFFLGLITIIFECVYFFRLYNHVKFENQRLKEDALVSQLNLLKQQISPHFLFNNLNALITLIPKEPELSVQFVQKLSAVYRQVLNDNEKNVVSLESELSFLKDYVFLYQIRFGQKLQVNFDIQQDLYSFKVIPMALQMLLENAIKHNVISSEDKLFIKVNALEGYVTVINNKQKKTSGVISNNTGLINIQDRYKTLTEKPVKIMETKDQFSVSIPLLN